jgi:hypothetical protein
MDRESFWQLSSPPPGTEHDGVNNVAIVKVVTRFGVNVVDAHLLQQTGLAEAILRGSTGTVHRQAH